MSRLGKQPIPLPKGVEASVSGGILTVKGSKGTLMRTLHPKITVTIRDGVVTLTPREMSEGTRMLWGTFHAHVRNMIKGVTEGFTKSLQLEGIGYRVALKGKDLEFALGFSHSVPFKAEEGVAFAVEKNMITITGSSIEKVGNIAASIRALKKPEPYKGKGIRYVGEVVRRKAGKKAAGA
ncbi:MAG: 50S ribosomal protein L6 [Patescibacteria group bacterium]